jgi:hypothetical protein
MAGNNIPSMDPAYNHSLQGSIIFAFSKMMQTVDGMMPVSVKSYNRATNRAEVQILINTVTTGGDSIVNRVIASVPVLVLGGGGMILSFPVKPGDLGWLIASDRDISNFMSTYTLSDPNTNRVKSFSDGLFIPDNVKQFTLAEGADNSVTLQNVSGSVFVSVSDTEVKIKSPTSVIIESASKVVVETPLLGVIGNITATGSITPNSPPP